VIAAVPLLDVGRVMVLAIAVAGVAHADPTPPKPSPGYVIQGPGGPTVGGLRTLPPICGVRAASLCRELESKHRGLELPAGNLNARKHV
jgi:hypothetical protein